MKVAEFIKIFCVELDATYKIHPYSSFALLCSAIELLGKCLDDEHEFETYSASLSSRQFNSAIRLMSVKYTSLSLHSALRNSMLHTLLVGETIVLGERDKTQHKHLESINFDGTIRTVIILETFYEDFKSACNKVLKKIETKELTHPKLKKEFITIKE